MGKRTSSGGKRATIYDVAEAAGVSHMTVSRVLNSHPSIRPATRERVLAAIEATHYTRSSIARSLAMRKTMRLGVLVDSPAQYGPNSTLRAFESAARMRGYVVSSVSYQGGSDDSVAESLAELRAQGVDGVCVIAPRKSSIDLVRTKMADSPLLLVHSQPGHGKDAVAIDQAAGTRMAIRHLTELGHRSIGHLAGPLDWFDAQVRHDTWAQELAALGLEVGKPYVGDWSSESGYAIGQELDLSNTTAVFVSNDQMALGLIHGLASRGVSVPSDVSVVGYDNVPDAAHYLPPLTTIEQDFDQLGRAVLDGLLAQIEQEQPARECLIEPRLIVRSSTAHISVG